MYVSFVENLAKHVPKRGKNTNLEYTCTVYSIDAQLMLNR